MTISVIESTDEKVLATFLAGFVYAKPDAKVQTGVNDEGVHWAILEFEGDADNATYSLTRAGLVFESTGVEI